MSLRPAIAAAFAIGLALLAAASARAEEIDALALIDAPVDYAADYSLTQDGETWRGTVIHAPGRERRDFTTALGTQAVLLRRDIDQAAVLWPQRKWYLATSLKALTGLLGAGDATTIDRHKDGSEMVGGERCTRYKVDGAFDGRLWVTRDGILMRAAGTLHLKGRTRQIETQLSHIKRAAIDADEFELPIGYHGIPVSPRLLGGGNSDNSD